MPQYSGREGDPDYSGPWTSTARPLTSVYTRVPTLQIHRQTEKKTAGSQAGAGRTDCPPSPLTAPPTARSGTRRSLSLPPTSSSLSSASGVRPRVRLCGAEARAEFVARPPPPAPRRQLAHSLRAGEAAWRRRHWLQRLRDAVEEGAHRAQGGAQVLLEEEPSALPSL